MTALSDYLKNEILDHIWNDGAWTAPTNIYAALCTAATVDSDDASTITEANYTGYARVEITAAMMDAAASGSKDNGSAITFGQCTAGSNTVTHVAIVDSASGAGNMLLHTALDSSLAVSNGVTPEFATGALVNTAN